MYCTQCGIQILSEVNFCPKCGNRISVRNFQIDEDKKEQSTAQDVTELASPKKVAEYKTLDFKNKTSSKETVSRVFLFVGIIFAILFINGLLSLFFEIPKDLMWIKWGVNCYAIWFFYTKLHQK